MKRFALPAVLLLAVPLFVGCTDQTEVPTAPLFAGKPGSGGGEVDLASTFSLQATSIGSSIFGDNATAYTTDGITRYSNSVCGVKAVVYAAGDGYLQTNNPKLKDSRCAVYPRKVGAVYENGSDFGGVVINANNIRGIAVGNSELRQLSVRIDGSACGRLLFSGEVGATYAKVTRVAEKTWTVESVPVDASGNTTARCETDLKPRMVGPFSFTITAN